MWAAAQSTGRRDSERAFSHRVLNRERGGFCMGKGQGLRETRYIKHLCNPDNLCYNASCSRERERGERSEFT